MKKIEKQYESVESPRYRDRYQRLNVEKTLDVIIDAVNTLIPTGGDGSCGFTPTEVLESLKVNGNFPQDKRSLREEFEEYIDNNEKFNHITQQDIWVFSDWWLSKIKTTVEGNKQFEPGLPERGNDYDNGYNQALDDLLSAFNLDK